ncbi:MAG: hypothetical protein IMF11_05065 [Proteobacteria bacterium]|nr:hypothetical protein [Pseudomonadota bacterium]
MKVAVTNDEIKFLANLIVIMNDQPTTVPVEFNDTWMAWVTAPIAQHAINPREAKALLTTMGILTDYKVPAGKIIETLLEAFVENYSATPGEDSRG